MFTENWDRRFLEVAKSVSTWSKDPSTGVGAVIVNRQKEIVGIGFNGFARGVDDDPQRYNIREIKYKLIVHAEQNAIIQAGHRAKDCTIYVYPSFLGPPICHDCAKLAIQAGIKGVVGYNPDLEHERAKNWEESIKYSRLMFREAGVNWYTIEEN